MVFNGVYWCFMKFEDDLPSGKLLPNRKSPVLKGKQTIAGHFQ